MKITIIMYLIKQFGLIATTLLILYSCNKDSNTNTCKSIRTGDLVCEQASGYKCSDLLRSADGEIENGKRYFVLNNHANSNHYTCDKFHIKVSVELKNTIPGLAIDMVISHGLMSDTITFQKDSVGIYTMEEYIIDLPSLYSNLDLIVIHNPVRLWLTSTGSYTNDKNLVESVLKRVYVEKQAGYKE